MKTKKCCICKKERNLSEFSKDNNSKDTLQTMCKSCNKMYSKKYRSEHKPFSLILKQKEQQELSAQGKKRCTKCHEIKDINKFSILQNSKISSICKNCNVKEVINWRDKNRKHYNTYTRNRTKNDPQYRASQLIRQHTHLIFKSILENKNFLEKTVMKHLSCNSKQFIEHIKNQFTKEMSFNNYGTYWEIDHIKSLSSFDLTDSIQNEKARNYLNIRPCIIAENRSIKNKKVA